MTPRLVLASSSPRRATLLRDAGIPFEVRAPDVDERPASGMLPSEAAVDIAVRKARAVKAPGQWVLAADTLLDHDGLILGKPRDELDAHTLLRLLSGGSHWVITGVALVPPNGDLRTGMAQTKVTFRELTDEEIDAYIRTGEPMDKAGAYAIQGGARRFVARVDGPMDNVVGLPMDVVRRLLAETGHAP